MNGLLQFIQVVRAAIPLINAAVAAVQQTAELSGNAKLQYVVNVVQQALKIEAGLEASVTQLVPLVEAAVAAFKLSQAAGFAATTAATSTAAVPLPAGLTAAATTVTTAVGSAS